MKNLHNLTREKVSWNGYSYPDDNILDGIDKSFRIDRHAVLKNKPRDTKNVTPRTIYVFCSFCRPVDWGTQMMLVLY